MRRFIGLFSFGLLVLSALGAQEKLTVAAAANMSSVEKALKEAFALAQPAIPVQFVFGASGALVTQISQGAPFDLFLSADLDFARKVVDLGFGEGPVRTYTRGVLILLTTTPQKGNWGLEALARPEVAKFALVNPEVGPYGRAAVQALTRLGLYDRIKSKQVNAQSVTQALQFTLTATGWGFVNRSALSAPELAPYRPEGVYWIPVPQEVFDPMDQGLTVLKASSNKAAADKFVDFLLSSQGQKVLGDSGYLPLK